MLCHNIVRIHTIPAFVTGRILNRSEKRRKERKTTTVKETERQTETEKRKKKPTVKETETEKEINEVSQVKNVFVSRPLAH